MVNPSLGAPAFVARLLPIFRLKHNILIKQVNTVMDMVHKPGSCVFHYDQKMFKVYHLENVSTALYSIRHPIKNPVLIIFSCFTI